jgi:hypothetical protein
MSEERPKKRQKVRASPDDAAVEKPPKRRQRAKVAQEEPEPMAIEELPMLHANSEIENQEQLMHEELEKSLAERPGQKCIFCGIGFDGQKMDSWGLHSCSRVPGIVEGRNDVKKVKTVNIPINMVEDRVGAPTIYCPICLQWHSALNICKL